MSGIKINISKKQLEANKTNALKWWVKTEEWKEKIKNNAIKHWLTANTYDKDFEKKLIKEYKVEWTLEKLLVKNICISKKRYERWFELETLLINNILEPSEYKKVYKSESEYKKYKLEKESYKRFTDFNLLEPTEPKYDLQKTNWFEFNYDMEKIKYLIEILGKYNYQNETRFSKNIINLLQLIKT